MKKASLRCSSLTNGKVGNPPTFFAFKAQDNLVFGNAYLYLVGLARSPGRQGYQLKLKKLG